MIDALITPEANRLMFDKIAKRYDLLNTLLSFGLDRSWRRKAVATLGTNPGHFLDVGCGTGELCLELLRQLPGSRVTGIDPSQSMLDRAGAKFSRAGKSSVITLETGDVRHLCFPDATFDGVITGFCLRNVTDHGAAIREMARVTKRSGRIVILELTTPNGFLLKSCHRFYRRVIVPAVGRIVSGSDAYQYLTDSIEHFRDPGEVRQLLQAAGCGETSIQPFHGGIVTLITGQRESGLAYEI